MKSKSTLLIFILFILFATSFTLLAQYKIKISVIADGGTMISGGLNRIISTIGQPLIGKINDKQNEIAEGFWEQVNTSISPVGVNEEKNIPKEYNLFQNYPNPFNPSTTIQFDLPNESFTKLEIFNILGRKVSTLVSEKLAAGTYKYGWKPEGMPSGIYFYRLNTEKFTKTDKMLLLK